MVNQSPRSRGHDTGLTAIVSVHFDYLRSFIYIHIIHICTYACMFKNLNDGQGETVNDSA